MARTAAPTTATHLDVLVVGAGLSGIGAGHYLQTECPWASYAIFEARDAIGGTWDLFRYPGIRSDSDMHTLGLLVPALGRREVDRRRRLHPAVHQGHRRRVRGRRAHPLRPPHHRGRLVDARVAAGTSRRSGPTPARRSSSPPASSSPAAATTATTTATCPTSRAWTTSPAPSCTRRPGPTTSTYAGKRIVVIGSGATAVTLVPVAGPLGRPRHHAAAVADLHRLAAREEPRGRPAAQAPAGEAGRRGRQVVPRPRDAGLLPGQPPLPAARQAPAAEGPGAPAPARLRHRHPLHAAATTRGTSASARCPNGDLFKAICDGDVLGRHRPHRALHRDGAPARPRATELEADIIVTATGLELLFLGGIALSVDGETVDPADPASPTRG